MRERWSMGGRAMVYASFNASVSLVLLAMGWVPWLVPVAFAAMLLDTLEGILRPAVGMRPTAIGIRQLVMSILFFGILVAGYLL